ncbi:MAG: prepilin-type N-terminal cleavage/methylation domain-containing protein [Deltaproteobacteria bacterium]|nr:prepilin-type N-terminal cleavage/methylation domain-containing protein [Deltaproteobacteria bacterium]
MSAFKRPVVPTRCQRRPKASYGFTLIELMTVVVILGVLAVVAIGAYSRHVRNAHKTEVISDLSNLSLRQRTVRSVQGHFASSTNCESDACTYPLASDIAIERGQIRWDVNVPAYTRDGQGDAAFYRGGGAQHGFDALRFLPEGGLSWCGYGTISGHGSNSSDPGTADTPPAATLATQIFPPGTEAFFARDWFYSYALCDFDFDGTYWAFTSAHYEDEVKYGTDATNTYQENE